MPSMLNVKCRAVFFLAATLTTTISSSFPFDANIPLHSEVVRDASELPNCFFDEVSICGYELKPNDSDAWIRLLENSVYQDYSMQILVGLLNRPRTTSRLVSPLFSVDQPLCLEFTFRMHLIASEPRNSSIGELCVKWLAENFGGTRMLWQRNSSHGNFLNEARVELEPATPQRIQLIFEATTGSASGARFSLDNVRLRDGRCEPIQPCFEGSFECGDGLCRPADAWCNGVQDCGTGVDEFLDCQGTCPPGWYKCNLTEPIQCVDSRKLCDGVFDCVNGEDERFCRCSRKERKCEDGLCLPIQLFCNGKQDCLDNSDERADCACPISREDGLACDGIPDCKDGADEADCNLCNLHEFACFESIYRCIPKWQVCDGKSDCLFGEDERECVRLLPDEAEGKTSAPDIASEGFLSVWVGSTDWSLVCRNDYLPTRSYLSEACKAIGYKDVKSARVVKLKNSRGGTIPRFAIARNASAPFGSQNFEPAVDCKSKEGIFLSCSNFACGQVSVSGNGVKLRGVHRIVGGTRTRRNWPWHVALYLQYPKHFLRPNRYLCGGSIIDQKWVLTAAHCLPDKLSPESSLLVVAGVSRRSSMQPTAQVREVQRSFLHPEYDRSTSTRHDIALLKLKTRFNWTSRVQPGCLSHSYQQGSLEGMSCTAIGWGSEEFMDTAKETDDLNELNLTILSNEECKQSAIVHRQSVHPGVLCAGIPDTNQSIIGPCQGDSGGGLACPLPGNEERYFLAGVTSYGTIPCATGPAGYTRVATYLEWIESVVSLFQR